MPKITELRGCVLLILAAATAGCSQIAPSSVYRSFAPFSQAGYRDKVVEEGVWEVTYETDITDRSGLAARYARYRAAELAQQAGYAYFQLIRVGGSRRYGPGVSSTTVELTVRGSRTRPAELVCERRSAYVPGTDASPCETYATDDALRQFVPLKRRGRPAAEAPPAAGG